MQLTKLEIKGFKSFKDKTTIHFNEGITGIVGPNGCGKSNVIDAIRWVLGEQKSSSLRSEKMGNIIFNGTSKQKPAQLAEASLTFSNSKNVLPTAYSTVCISRRYYRNGDSEYLLNSVPCRLKDITNLFMDTGINSNSYAIIELKMIDELLNDKENSRRALFEEAAGISKYRSRKKDTIKKLKDTDDDLVRIEDLLDEIEKNKNSMERQAKQAERYFQIKAEYKKNSTLLTKINFLDFHKKMEGLDKKTAEEQVNYSSLVTKLAEAELGISTKKNDLIRKEQLLASRQKTLNKHSGKIHSLENSHKLKLEKVKHLESTKENLKASIELNEKKIAELKSEKTQNQEEKKSWTRLITEDQITREQNKAIVDELKLDTDKNTRNLSEIKSDFKITQAQLFELKKTQELSKQKLNSILDENEQLNSLNKEYLNQSANLNKEMFSLERLILDKNRAEKDLNNKTKQFQNEILKLNEKLKKNIDFLSEKKKNLAVKQSTFELKTQMHERMEGQSKAIQFLGSDKAWKQKSPLLFELLNCKKESINALSSSLKPFLNHFVVDTEKDALESISKLKDKAIGSASFFILERINKVDIPKEKLSKSENKLIEQVKVETKYKKLIQFLIGDIHLISTTENNAKETRKIALDGSIFEESLSITGGSIEKENPQSIGILEKLNLLKKEIKELNNEIETLETEKDKLVLKSETRHEKLKTSENEELQLRKELSLLEQQKLIINTKIEQLTIDQVDKEANKEKQNKLITELKQEIKALEPRVETLENKVEFLSNQDLDLEESLLELRENLELNRNSYNEINLQYHQKENKISSLEEQFSYLEKSQTELESENSLQEKKLNETLSNIQNKDEDFSDFDNQIENLKTELENIRSGVKEAEKDYFHSRAEINDEESEISNFRKNKESSSELLMLLDKEKNTLSLSIHRLLESLKLEFDIELDKLKIKTEESELKDTKPVPLMQEIQKQKVALEKMGSVNPMALEAFNEIKNRHEFISNEKDDLITAKNSLMETMEEIDGIAKENFMNSFVKIKSNFIKVFRSLFSEEDNCDLRLTAPSDPLNSKIEIMAQPKGKRPLSINQLSGGEKTLTATALLFAIYLLKPAPFCIFDEVDAPLDDANIDKFNKIIHEFSHDSQFIIVTHNKRTMASTDIMYGVTMIEQGVSRLIPVNLKEFNYQEG